MNNKNLVIVLVVMIVTLKGIVYPFLGDWMPIGGGSDAHYYDLYARGLVDLSVNAWSDILRYLNEKGFYSRDGVAISLLVVSLTILPWYYSKCVPLEGRVYAFLLVLLYPSIYFFTVDIYRDVVMYLIFVLCILSARAYYESVSFSRYLYFALFILFGMIAFWFREYLGLALIVSPFLAWLYHKVKPRLYVVVSIYLIGLGVMQASGYLQPLFEYRGFDGFQEGGASLGIGLMEKTPTSFLFFYIVSFFAQVGGLFFPNSLAIASFILEGIPFLFACVYILKNLRFSDRFCSFLFAFFIVYTTIWVVGNDNLGTAVRLRVPSYLAVFACVFIIRSRKAAFNHRSHRERGQVVRNARTTLVHGACGQDAPMNRR